MGKLMISMVIRTSLVGFWQAQLAMRRKLGVGIPLQVKERQILREAAGNASGKRTKNY